MFAGWRNYRLLAPAASGTGEATREAPREPGCKSPICALLRVYLRHSYRIIVVFADGAQTSNPDLRLDRDCRYADSVSFQKF